MIGRLSGEYLIDGRGLTGHSGVRGIGMYLRGLLSGFDELGISDRISLMLSRGDPPPDAIRGGGPHLGPTVPVLKRRLQPLADPLMIGRLLRGSSAAVYHSIEWAQPLPAPLPVAITVHDLIPFLFPRQYPWMRRERLLALRLLRRADAVITPSAATARDVERLGHVDPARITVVHHGVNERFQTVTSATTGAGTTEPDPALPPFLLAVGVFDPRKRFDLLLDVFARVRQDHPVQLVVAGSQGAFAPAVQAALTHSGLAAHVRLAGFVPDEELIALYRSAACLVFPSACEGFGLPVLEAMTAGCPVVAFDNSAIPEVVGDAGLLAPDGDSTAMAALVSSLLADPAGAEGRSALSRARAGSFSWRTCADQTLAVYERIRR
ncbi:MAG: glycosyltransferase family 1 protein [Candidatus Dormibacteria bacterium]